MPTPRVLQRGAVAPGPCCGAGTAASLPAHILAAAFCKDVAAISAQELQQAINYLRFVIAGALGMEPPGDSPARKAQTRRVRRAIAAMLPRTHEPDDALLEALDATIEPARRLTTLTERLLTRAASGERLTDQERTGAEYELANAQAGFEQLHTRAIFFRQKLRPM
jgi:hypothetical protein